AVCATSSSSTWTVTAPTPRAPACSPAWPASCRCSRYWGRTRATSEMLAREPVVSSNQRRWSAPPLGPLAVIGVGQIGGSVALAARVAGAVSEVVAWSRNRETLDRARALGIIDRAAASVEEAARGAALVVLATPVRSLGPL